MSALPDMSGQQIPANSAMTVWGKRILMTLLLLSLLALVGYGLKKLLSGGAPHKRQITTVK
ncbi:MAG TPA: TonB C-terminal domain-containing protein, partial [Methylophilus sp.]